MLAGAGHALAQPSDASRAEWRAFQSRFLAADGRVVDTGNGGVSHSEGQGWALFFAVRADDQAAFQRILGWTRRVLKRPRDELHAWRYRPEAAMPVEDLNNATDGDIFIAWALLEAGERWGNAEYTAIGIAIARDILRHLVRRAGAFSVLLPGARGFEHAGTTIINPSYYVFPAFSALARAVPDRAWVRVAADGLVLLRASRFGRWGLPPDWAVLSKADGEVKLPQSWPPRFSFDAVRVPLYLAWAGLGAEPAMGRARNFWTDPSHPFVPAWTDLESDLLAPYPASPGVMAVARLASQQRGNALPALQSLASVVSAPDYYSAALSLLVRFAWGDAEAAAG
ncbi:glycosyl hydrolase family 5 [Belnapia sp. T6]|uniref:Glucanase n=1 Tax=Belnapia mucosa TaxID=2804532 RepID=A0ABS1UZR6_9PROT|nr:glycosyl hydrolase family 8 [Belnapia mucosa]MBL6454951.1 glycosyl hydrolase family 5 [Belnapia mucosa]